jgi:hypothetical protein
MSIFPCFLNAIRKCLLLTGILFFTYHLSAQNITGKVYGSDGLPLAYSSIYIKGTTKGTTANKEGQFFLELPDGTHTIVCAHVGYKKSEATVTATRTAQEIVFVLLTQITDLKNVVVKANAEDPAFAIIRNAIKVREAHLNEVKQWQVMVYMKGLVRTYTVPRRIFGIKVDPNRDIIDSSGKGIIYFSESLTRYSRRMPNDFKEEVISAKLSGRSQGFGFNSPNDMEVNLYENNITLEGLNSRGFISPINNNALYFYRYKFEGTFYEDGQEINKIRVIPRRKFEPCFAGGYINIIEGSWRIHSFDLHLTKESQMEMLDSVRLTQQMLPVDGQYWLPQQTNFEAHFSLMGFNAGANFTAVYSDYETDKDLSHLFKGNIVKSIDTAANKKSITYWDSIRPAPLTYEERNDYLKKDTLERRMQDPHYLDSIDRRFNKPGVMKLLLTGGSIFKRKNKMVYNYPSILQSIQYNTVEGWLLDVSPTIRHWGDTGAYVFQPHIRYAFASKHFNAAASISKTFGQNYNRRWNVTVSGGRYVYQINPNNPIDPLVNSLGTLLYHQNHMKIYEKNFGEVTARHQFNNGLRLTFAASYEDRIPLTNTDTSFTWVKWDNRRFTSNYPEELQPGSFVRHQALLTSVKIRWQPGQKFVQYPTRLVSLGSDQPVFKLDITKAWKNVLGSDVGFSKWMVNVEDDFNMRLGGIVRYNFGLGGFFGNGNVQLPDWQHFNGNLTIVARQYTHSFQLAPYYANSTKDNFYGTGNFEWHLNGFLTNKIPLIRRWNWGLVTGSNAFYVDKSRNYFEFFVGIENILKVMRIDFVWGYDGFNNKPKSGIVIGFSGILTGEGIE